MHTYHMMYTLRVVVCAAPNLIMCPSTCEPVQDISDAGSCVLHFYATFIELTQQQQEAEDGTSLVKLPTSAESKPP